MFREIMDCCSDPLVREVTFVGPRQVGKTASLVENVVGYYIDQDPSQIGVFFENQDKADAWSKERFMPMVEDTPCLREKLSFGKGAGDSKNTINYKDFAGGFLVILSAGSDANVASRSLRVIIKDELSKYPITKLGDTAARIDALSTTFFNAKIINLSTPTIRMEKKDDPDDLGDAPYCRATERWLASDQRLPYMACPFCGHLQIMMESRFKFTRPGNSGNLVDEVWYECENPACSIAKIRETHKPRIIANGRWIAQRPFRGHAGFAGYPALWSPWVSWEKYFNAYLRMKRQRETFKTFVNEWRGEAWDELMAAQKDISVYVKRCEDYEKVPLGAAILTGYVDVQQEPPRLEAEIRAWGIGGESWGMAHKIFYGDVSLLSTGHLTKTWNDMLEFVTQTWEHESGEVLRPSRVFIDMGYLQHVVLKFCKGKRGLGIWPSKGMNDHKAPLVTRRPVKSVKDRVFYFPIGPNAGKEIVLGRMELDPEHPGPGYMHFRKGHYDDEYFRQLLTSERYKWIRGVKVYEKISSAARNEALDLCVGNLAAFESLGTDPAPYVAAMRKRWEERTREAEGGRGDGEGVRNEEPEQNPVQNKKKPGGFVMRWKQNR